MDAKSARFDHCGHLWLLANEGANRLALLKYERLKLAYRLELDLQADTFMNSSTPRSPGSDLLDMPPDRKSLYFLADPRTIKQLSCSTHHVLSSISTAAHLLVSLQYKHLMVFSMYQTIIGEQYVTLYDGKLTSVISSVCVNTGVQLFDSCPENLNLIVAVGTKQLKKISFLTTVDLPSRTVTSHNFSVAFHSLKKLEFCSAADKLYTYLVATSAAVFVCKIAMVSPAMTATIPFVIPAAQSVSLFDVVVADDDVYLLGNDGKIRAIYNIAFSL